MFSAFFSSPPVVIAALEGPCFSFCSPPLGPVPAGTDNNTLLPYAVCGQSTASKTGINIVPTNRTCPPPMDFYGEATIPFDVLAGCAAESTASLADVSVTQGAQIVVPALEGEAAPSPGGPAPESKCKATSADGKQLTYDQCT